MRKPPAQSTHPELDKLLADPTWTAKYPVLLNPDQACDLLQVPKHTLYAWSSQGVLDGCKVRLGKHLRIIRNRLLSQIYEGTFHVD